MMTDGSAMSLASLTCGQTIPLTIETLVSDGRGLARYHGLVVLVRDALPQQTILARIVSKQKRLLEAELETVLEHSPYESPAPCPHASQCGGCAWQSLAYAQQLHYKERIVRDALERIAKVNVPLLPIVPSPQQWGYRNKMEFAFASDPDRHGATLLGLRQRASHTIVEVTNCLLQTPLTMRIVAAVRQLAEDENLPAWDAEHQTGVSRFLVVREPRAGGCLVEWIVGDCRADAALGARLAARLREAVPELTAFVLSRRRAATAVAYAEETLYQEGTLEETLGDLQLSLHHNAFFQVNTEATRLLYEAVRAGLRGLSEPLRLWDIYSGIGSIGLYLAQHLSPQSSLTAVESMPNAVRCAKANATRLKLTKYTVFSGDAHAVLQRLVKQSPCPDAVVVDPPRAGLDAVTKRCLCTALPSRLLYVSCNPATLARDLASLCQHFHLESVQPVDMFPQTPHVESVAILSHPRGGVS